VRGIRVWGRLLGLRQAVVEGVGISEGGELVVEDTSITDTAV